MTTINISLPDKLKKQADSLVKEGYYASFSDLVRSALRGQLVTNDTKITNKETEVGKIKKKLYEFAQLNKVKYLGLFGSASRGELSNNSDIDVLISFNDKAEIGLLDLVKMEQDLSNQLDRRVELITKVNKYVEPYIQNDLVNIYGQR
jgi:uncharacterized protein